MFPKGLLLLLVIGLLHTAKAQADTKPWQLPVNDGPLVTINIYCLADIDKHHHITLDCVQEQLYLPGWNGKRTKFYGD